MFPDVTTIFHVSTAKIKQLKKQTRNTKKQTFDRAGSKWLFFGGYSQSGNVYTCFLFDSRCVCVCCFPCSLLVPVVMFPFVRLYLSCASRLSFSFDMQPDGGVLSTKVATFELHRVVGKHQDRLTLAGHLNDIYAPR